MQPEKQPASKAPAFSLQEYLSLGYLYLVILGIISDVIYFKFLGIDILNYATILDVLITPVNIVVHDLKVLFFFSLSILGIYLLMTRVSPRLHAQYRDKAWYRKLNDVERLDQQYARQDGHQGVVLLIILIFSMFLGFGLGRGAKVKDKIAKGETKMSHTLIFNDNESKRVRIVGQNSQYVFYVVEHEREVSIAPISQSIKEIKKLKEEEQK